LRASDVNGLASRAGIPVKREVKGLRRVGDVGDVEDVEVADIAEKGDHKVDAVELADTGDPDAAADPDGTNPAVVILSGTLAILYASPLGVRVFA
jgi:hypothetical protein